MAAFKAFVTNLGKYNEGYLVGEWLELPADEEEIEELLERIGCKKTGYEEYFITDYDFKNYNIVEGFKEYENLHKLNVLAEEFDALDNGDKEVIAAYIEANGTGLGEALRELSNCVLYSAETLKDLAQEFVEDGCFGEIPERISNYIDYAAIARDLGFSGYAETTYGVLYCG